MVVLPIQKWSAAGKMGTTSECEVVYSVFAAQTTTIHWDSKRCNLLLRDVQEEQTTCYLQFRQEFVICSALQQ